MTKTTDQIRNFKALHLRTNSTIVADSWQDRAQLVTFEQAKRACLQRGYSGIGIAITDDLGLVALDFDDVVVDGVIRPDVAALCEGTYTEFSPSGTGVRAFMHGVPAKGESK